MAQQESGSKSKSGKSGKLMLVRYGRLGLLGWFEHNENQVPKKGGPVVVQTERGLELGEIVGPFNYRGGQFRAAPEQVENYFGGGEGRENAPSQGGSFVRFASHEDVREQQHLEQSAQAEAEMCRKFTDEMGLPMKIIEAEHLFGGERIIVYFTSEGRVDFRELVRRLAKEYQTRIELRQIGSRDEARLSGDYETCGQECCCRRFLKILAPVNMRMAKLQKATLDPSKISGHCGRLKCCLRFEDATYIELRERLPGKGQMVMTPKGVGRVMDLQVLTQLVVVQTNDGDRRAWPLEDIQAASGAADRAKQETGQQSSESLPAEPAAVVDEAPGDLGQETEPAAEKEPLQSEQEGTCEAETEVGGETGETEKSPQQEHSGRRRRGRKNRRRQNNGPTNGAKGAAGGQAPSGGQ